LILSPSKSANWKDFSNTSFKPIDSTKSLKRTFNKQEIVDALLSQYYQVETQEQVTLPDKLIDVIVYWSKDAGKSTGTDTNPDVSGSSYSYSESYSRRSTANVTGDIYFKIEKGFSGSIPATQHTFFMEIDSDGKVNEDILSTINGRINKNIKKWPNIKRVTENLVIVSGSKSKTEAWTKGETVSINGFSKVDRRDDSFDVDRNANTVNVPDAIHPTIAISEVEEGDFQGVDSIPVYEVYPKTLAATPITEFPDGEYLVSGRMELYKWGLVRVTAITVNITSEYT
jgi:hypothetical protein